MSRRIVTLLTVILLALASLASVAALATTAAPTFQVTPRLHHQGKEGYFRLSLRPEQTPPLPLGVEIRVVAGDAWLVSARTETLPDGDPSEASVGAAASTTGHELIVCGRYARPGPVRLTILGRTVGNTSKPLMNLSFNIPGGEFTDPEVRSEWARQQQALLANADPAGEDSYSQYWNLAVAPRYGLKPILPEAGARMRSEPPDLYSVFTGAAAIQESLQLELLGGDVRTNAGQPAGETAVTPEAEVPLGSLSGPSVQSHPFREMLKGRIPDLPPLASFIPEDQYAVFFSDINRQIELADLMDEWGGNLLQQVEANARDFKVREKLSRQLCLENSWLTRMFGDRVIADMAMSGNDPFLKEGTGFTVLFSLRDQKRFRRQMEKRYARAASESGAVRSGFNVDGMNGFGAVSPDRRISSYTLILGNTAVVSNSLSALRRIAGAAGGRVPSLAQADDFRYMRTLFPQNSGEEDIFIYLSDAHIRNLVGPARKIGEARRMRCSANLGLLANARLWYRAEHRAEPTLPELASGGYLGKNPPVCPDHGGYLFDGRGEPYCSLHNRQGFLTPAGELPLEQVTPQEAARYRAFVENYNRYWTKFFDPIGIRVKMGKDIRIQTCILPLIENSWYDGLAAFSGRNPGELSEAALLPRTIASLRGHMASEWLSETRLKQKLTARGLKLDWLGDELALNLCDGQVFFSAGGRAMGLIGREMGRSSLEPLVIGYLGSALNLPTYLTVKVTDAGKAEQAIPALFRALAPGRGHGDEFSVETYTIEDHGGKPLYVASFNLWLIKLRLFAVVLDDRLVIASRRDIITDLMEASARRIGATAAKHEGNLELSLYRTAFRQLEETVNLGWQEDLRQACHKNLPLVAILLKPLGLPADRMEATVFGLRGYQPYCPSGGRYLIDEQSGAVTCSDHGSARQPRQPAAGDKDSKTLALVNSLERVNARLSFTPEGLMTTVDIRRNK